jgi:hypothetical protein
LEIDVSKKYFRSTFALIAAGLFLSAPAIADGLQPGYWKIVSSPTLNGATAAPQTKMLCLTPAEAADLPALFSPRMATVNSECQRTENEATPTSLKWRLQCTGQMTMDVAGIFKFPTPQHYTAEVNTKGTIAGQSMETRVTIEAERTGECPQ